MYWLIYVYVIILRVVEQCMIISVNYLFQNYYYYTSFVFLIQSYFYYTQLVGFRLYHPASWTPSGQKWYIAVRRQVQYPRNYSN